MLLIDPDAASRSAIEQAFGTQNIPIDVFETATAALNAMTAAAHAGDPYRIALLDQNLQALDGETLGQAISADPVHRDTLLVLISGTHTAQDVHRLTQAGFSAWLPAAPPVSMLFDTVGTLCNWIADKDVPRFISAGVTTDDQSATPDFLPFDGYRILAIDDNPVNLQVVERMLARMGCSVDTASGGESAIAMFSHANYDLVLVDCQMPGLDGYQTTALLRSQEDDNRHTPIIGWSARSGRKERDTCLAIGMDDFIAKPLRLQTLNALLAKWLSPVRSKAAPADVRPDDELDATRQMFGEDFAELAELFLTDTPLRIASLKKAKGDSDAAACAKLAHALCGSCASIGATALAAICRDLEIRARSGAIGDSSRIDALENEYARIHGRLQCMMHEGSIDAPRTRRDHHQ
jgi:CheY-like chemotaxis protein/HPt (histidine-containing phosphotransfer) domain-containing protein